MISFIPDASLWKIPREVRYREKYSFMILNLYFSDFKEINALCAEARYEFMKMNKKDTQLTYNLTHVGKLCRTTSF